MKGTQVRSPMESMKPKPSVTMSIVVRIAVCDNHLIRERWSAEDCEVRRAVRGDAFTDRA